MTMKNKTIYAILLLGLIVSACSKQDYKIETPSFNVVPQKVVCKVGEPIVFDMSGSADLVMFYSGEFGNDYAYHDRGRLTQARMNLSFETQATTSGSARRFNPAYTPVSYSTDFNGVCDFENMNAAQWNDISSMFEFPPVDGMVDVNNGKMVVASGNGDLTDLFPSQETPIYLRFYYKVNKYEAASGIGRTAIKISNFNINGITQTGSIPLYSISDIPWDTVRAESWNTVTSGNDKTYFPPQRDYLQFQCEWNAQQDRELWMIAGPIYMAEEINSGVEPAVCIKAVADPDLHTYSYSYTTPGTYKPTFVAANSSVYGRREVVKQFEVVVLEDAGSIAPPTDEEWPN